jgi:hypothetical protein
MINGVCVISVPVKLVATVNQGIVFIIFQIGVASSGRGGGFVVKGMVNELEANRIFLGGDAAHILQEHKNTGIQDMINLCWKLALVIQGRASARHLRRVHQD